MEEPNAEGPAPEEEAKPERSFRIWLYLVPIFILAAWPTLRWLQKANSNNLELSQEDYSAFSSDEAEIRKPEIPHAGSPELTDGTMNTRYRSGTQPQADERADPGERAREEERTATPAPRTKQRTTRTAAGQRPEVNAVKAREQQAIGYTEGVMTKVMGSVINSPRAMSAILNNKYVINGFMARNSVREATGSAQGLAKFLKSNAPAHFINNSLVQAAVANPAIVSAAASSGFANALLSTPAAQELMNNPKLLGDLFESNPQLVAMTLNNPNAMKLLTNPEVAGLVNQFDTSAIPDK
jgi:hypothetical protein